MKALKILKIATLVVLFIAAFSAVVMYLWNWLMPEIFGLPIITFWQAAGLLILSKLIFGFGKGGGHQHRHGPPPWSRWKKKWRHMPHEKREEWKQKFADNWCRASKEYHQKTTDPEKQKPESDQQ